MNRKSMRGQHPAGRENKNRKNRCTVFTLQENAERRFHPAGHGKLAKISLPSLQPRLFMHCTWGGTIFLPAENACVYLQVFSKCFLFGLLISNRLSWAGPSTSIFCKMAQKSGGECNNLSLLLPDAAGSAFIWVSYHVISIPTCTASQLPEKHMEKYWNFIF